METERQAPGGSDQSPRLTNEPNYGNEISFLEIMNTVLSYRRFIARTSMIFFILIVGITLLQPRQYSTTSSFLSQSSSGTRGLSTSIATQLGVSVPTGEAGQSPQFYADLITSREILNKLVDRIYSYQDNDETIQASLPDLFKIENESKALVNENTIRTLKEHISVTTDQETGLVSFTIQTKWPKVSEGIGRDVLDLVNHFNLSTRQTQATAERIFIEGRLEEVEAQLRSSEDALQDFLQKNRQWKESPELAFVHERLTREVAMRQQVFTTLNQSYEQARIDEVRDTPVITVIESPVIPVIPDRRRLVFKSILALIGGMLMGIIGAFGRNYLIRGQNNEVSHFTEFERLKKDAWEDIKNPVKMIFH